MSCIFLPPLCISFSLPIPSHGKNNQPPDLYTGRTTAAAAPPAAASICRQSDGFGTVRGLQDVARERTPGSRTHGCRDGQPWISRW